MELIDDYSGGPHIVTDTSVKTEENTWYDVRITVDDDEVEVFRVPHGQIIYETQDPTISDDSINTDISSKRTQFVAKRDGRYRIDNVLIRAIDAP